MASRFHLRGTGGGLTDTDMNYRAAHLVACVVIFSGCEEKKEITVTETRVMTTKDGAFKLFATSDERFSVTQPSPVKADTPAGWRVVPASQFRLLNYRFGEAGMGEVWVSLSQGTILDNANRWLKQFGKPPLDQAQLAKLPSSSVAGSTGVWVTADGDYAGGMGAAENPGFALAGVIASVKGKIITVKMVGPKAEVEAARPMLADYIKSVRMAE
jgi:uncharacterized protein YbdZ (MbtH family)